jgi:uncharacterized NAD-dependent epimerase/dehydratase family protein
LDGTAIVVTNGLLDTPYGKTAHGLIRGTDRYEIVAFVDAENAGRDAGEVLDGQHRKLPIYATMQEALEQVARVPDYCVIGCATLGGAVPEELLETLAEALQVGMTVVNGLHQPLADDPRLRGFKKNASSIMDIRTPKSLAELHYWSGDIMQLRTPRIAVLGTDCGLGKRTTSRFLLEACNREGIKTELVSTGQTGWLQGSPYAIMLDAIPNDFVCGELEHAVLSCARDLSPDLILIEGQSSLRNPSGPCGFEHIVSAQSRGVILQHAPGRGRFECYEHVAHDIPPIEEEIELIRLLGARTLAVTLNGMHCSPEQLIEAQESLTKQLQLPVIRPLEEGVGELVTLMQDYIKEEKSR